MGSPGRELDNKRHGTDIEVGSDGAHYKDYREHAHKAEQRHSDWAEGLYYDEQFAEDDDREESVQQWSDGREFEDQREDNRVREPDESMRTDGREHPGQYNNNNNGFERENLGASGNARRKGHYISARVEGDGDEQPVRGVARGRSRHRRG